MEPEHSNDFVTNWISDKTRLFFDAIHNRSQEHSNWLKFLTVLENNIYVFEMCANRMFKSNFFTITFRNVGLEVLSLLILFSHNYSFVRIKKGNPAKVNSDLESSFQCNLLAEEESLDETGTCLFVGIAPHHEGTYLGTRVRARYNKGAFDTYVIGPDATSYTDSRFIGSEVQSLPSSVGGGLMVCQSLTENNETGSVVLNEESCKRNDDLLVATQDVVNSASPDQGWESVSVLSPTLDSYGIASLTNFDSFDKEDFKCFSTLYSINDSPTHGPSLKKILKTKLLFLTKANKKIKKIFTKNTSERTLLLQGNPAFPIFIEENKGFPKVAFLDPMPATEFFGSGETFFNTLGLTRKAVKTILRWDTKTNLQYLKEAFRSLKKQTVAVLMGDSAEIITFNLATKVNITNFAGFAFIANNSLKALNFYLRAISNNFFLTKSYFPPVSKKVFNGRIKYWLDDFFTGGLDGYSWNSLALAKCSASARAEFTNFF